MSMAFVVVIIILCIIGGKASLVEWVGTSGQWHVPAMWSTGSVPDVTDSVLVNVSANVIVSLTSDVLVSQFTLVGGVINILGNSTLAVNDAFTFHSGMIKGPDVPAGQYGAINNTAVTTFSGSRRKHLRSVNFRQLGGSLSWTGGDLVFWDSTLTIAPTAVMEVRATASNKLRILSDYSRSEFDFYPSSTLNTQVNLAYAVPSSGAIFDIVVENAVHVTTATGEQGIEIFDLTVQQDPKAATMYAQHVHEFREGYQYTLYNRTVSGVGEDQCARLCHLAYTTWCRSFDYFFFNQSCSLSAFRYSQVGGLTPRTSNVAGLAYPLSHYQRRTEQRAMDSMLEIAGQLDISGDSTTWGSALEFNMDIDLHVTGSMALADAVNATFSRTVTLGAASAVTVAPQSVWSMVGDHSSLNAVHGSAVEFTAGGGRAAMQLLLVGGVHSINALVSGAPSLTFARSMVRLYPMEAVTTGDDAADSDTSTLTLTSLVLADAANVEMGGHSANTLRAESVHVITGSTLSSNNITINAAQELVVDANSSVSASGKGYAIATGPGAGADHQLGGSGGSHAGRGGPSKVEAKGRPYGSLTVPASAGSGGGRGFFADSTGGAGGGVLHLYSLSGTVRVDGRVEADGETGIAAGGGGAGGSILIQADTLTGSGVISATGGDGDFSGGVAAGGGGSGGRISIAVADFTFSGRFDITGGFLQPTHDISGQEQASPGLVYFAVAGAEYAVVTATQPFSDFADNLANKIPIPTDELRALSGYAHRPAYLSEGLSAGTECTTQLHIIGEASLSLSANTHCLSDVLGTSSDARLLLEDSVTVSFAGATLELASITLEARNAILPNHANIAVRDDAYLRMHSDVLLGNAFGLLQVLDGGHLVSVNSSATLTSQQLSVLRGATVIVEDDDLTVTAVSVQLEDAILRPGGASASVALIVFDPSTSVTAKGTVVLQSMTMVFEGPVTVADGAVVLAPVTTDDNSFVSLNGTSLLNVRNASLVLKLPIYVNAALGLGSGAGLVATSGGRCNDGGSVNISATATISFEGGTFNVAALCAVSGPGAVQIQNGGILRPALTVTASTPAVRVLDGGRIEFLSRGQSLLDTNGSYDSSVFVETGGVLLVGNDTRLSIAELSLDGGEIRLSSVSAAIELYGAANVFRSGLVEGNGSLTVLSAAELELSPGIVEPLTLLEVAVVNHGKVLAKDNVINWARSASLDNYGNVSYEGTQVWQHDELLYDYLNLEHCTASLRSSENLIVLNRTAVECAALCSHHFLSRSRELPLGETETFKLSCLSFLYSEAVRTCQLQSAEVESYLACAPVNASEPSYAWQLYVKAPRWVASPILYNAPGAVLRATATSSSELQISVYNEGLVVADALSALSVTHSLNQSAYGSLEANGEVYIRQVGYSPLSGTFEGTGTVQFASANDSTVLLISTTVNSTTLDVEFHGNARIHGIPQLRARNLRLVDGHVQASGSALKLHVLQELAFTGDSSFVTSRDLIDEPAEVSLPSPVDASFTCLPAFDLCIAADTVSLADSGELLWSNGYLEAATLSVAAGAQISSTGRGYSSHLAETSEVAVWTGEYRFLGSSGGSHGGLGGSGYGQLGDFDLTSDRAGYGGFHFANRWGAAGGSGAGNKTSSGGGASFVHVTELILDGAIRSDGASPVQSLAGGGAGGSVHISADSLSGTGLIAARGGAGGVEREDIIARAGGGGGGRISLYVNDLTAFTGMVSAVGGAGFQSGSSGTVFTIDRAGTTPGGTLTVTGPGGSVSPGTALCTVVSTVSPYGVLTALTATDRGCVLYKAPAETVAVKDISGDGTATVIFTEGTTLLPSAGGVSGTLVLSGIRVVIANATLSATDVLVGADAELSMTSAGRTSAATVAHYEFNSVQVQAAGSLKFDYHAVVLSAEVAPELVVLNVSASLDIQAGGRVHSDSQGHRGSYHSAESCYDAAEVSVLGHGVGCGAYGTTGGGGGAYGGNGGNGISAVGGSSYGSIAHPADFGSGGGGSYPHLAGGNGGGVVRIVANAIVAAGEISCDGGQGVGAGTGGGSGGSVWLTVNQLIGSGSIHADGGAALFSSAYLGGAGSGGRVAIHCQQCVTLIDPVTGPQFSFTGNVTTRGGGFALSSAPGAVDQVPIWSDYGLTALNALSAGPARAAAGTVFWSTDADAATSLVVRNSLPSSVTVDYVRAVSNVATASSALFTLPDAETEYHDAVLGSVGNVVVGKGARMLVKGGFALAAQYVFGDSASILTVQEGSELTLPPQMNLTSVNVVLKGSLTGARQLHLRGASTFTIYPNATWSAEGGPQTDAYDAQSLTYHEITSQTSLLNTSVLTIDDTAGIVFAGSTGYGQQRAVLLCDKLHLLSATSHISADGMGHGATGPGTSDPTQGYDSMHPMHQASGNISYGDGGWHAGRGGGAYDLYSASGNAFFPVAYGAAGGSTAQAAGATGGGAVRIIAKEELVVNGRISADGQSCSQANTKGDPLCAAGAGAGGSVWLEVLGSELTGSGSITARGGDGCANGGGGGSGGRVAVYTPSADFAQFTGTIDVGAGTQNAAIQVAPGVYPTAPSGGTIFVAEPDGTAGMLAASNNGMSGSGVHAFDSCSYGPGRDSFEIASVVLADADLVLDSSCVVGLSAGIVSAANAPAFPVVRTGTTHSGALLLAGNATVVTSTALVLDDVSVKLRDATLVVEDEMTLKNATVTMALQEGRVVSYPSSLGVSSTTGRLNHIASLSPPASHGSHSMSYINIRDLNILTNSTLQFDSTQASYLSEVSNTIAANSITVSASARVLSTAVFTNPEIEWNSSAAVSTIYQHYGQHSGQGFAASGGGHAGSGTVGAGNNAGGGATRGDPLTPFGGGGPGGNDLRSLTLGGAGGGGLHFNVNTSFVLDGIIDVSGASAALSSCAGGGAGGSIYIEATTAIFSGAGELRAQGGNGSVSATSATHGGAGSGGRVAVQACVDEFDGVLTAQGGLSVELPSGLPQSVSTQQYQKYAKAADLSHIGSTGYRSMQHVVAGSAGTVFRAGLFADRFEFASADEPRSQCLVEYNSAFSYPLTTISVEGWSAGDLHSDPSALTAAMVSSMRLASPSAISSVANIQTPVSLPFDSGVSAVHVNEVTLVDSNVKLTGSGNVSGLNFDASHDAALTVAGDITLSPSSTLRISSFTVNLTEQATLAAGVDVSVLDGGQLLLNYGDLTDDFVNNPNELYDPTELQPNLTVRHLVLRNNASIYGSRIIIHATSISILENSTFSADALGMFGGYCSAVPTAGSGIGGGASGEVGADGGGHGGYGAPGLGSLYNTINADQFVGSTADSSVLAPLNTAVINGTTYGDLLAPVQYGGGGGATYCPNGDGGRGGGVIKIHLEGDITIDESSSLSADGQGVFGGGGGGAGGSIWILDTNRDPTDVHGRLLGSGRVSARGGHVCATPYCLTDVDYPGGPGGGGRVRIDKKLDSYSSAINVLSGTSNQTLDILLTKRMGTFVRVQAISTLVLAQEPGGAEALDIVFTQTPLFMVQVITTTGTGTGDRDAEDHMGAVVKGFWTLRYRAQGAEAIKLSSQATAAEVKAALQSLDYPELVDIGVTRRPSSGNGWSWSITFYDEVDRVVPIKIDGSRLWSSNFDSIASVSVLNPYTDSLDGSGDILATDAPLNISSPQLQSMMDFNQPVLVADSYGYWRNYRTLRVVPQYSADPNYFRGLLYQLRLVRLQPVATMLGKVTSTSHPYLLESYEPNWQFPTTAPTTAPTV